MTRRSEFTHSASSIKELIQPLWVRQNRAATSAVVATSLLGAGIVLLNNNLIAELFSSSSNQSNAPTKQATYVYFLLSLAIAAQAVQVVLYERTSARMGIRYRDAQEKTLLITGLQSGDLIRNRLGISQAISLLTQDLGRTMAGSVSILAMASNSLCLFAYISWFLFQFAWAGAGLCLIIFVFFFIHTPMARAAAFRDALLMDSADEVKVFTEDHLTASEEIHACNEEYISSRLMDKLIENRRVAHKQHSATLSLLVALNVVTPAIGIMSGFAAILIFQPASTSIARILPVLLWALPNMLGHMVQIAANVQSVNAALVSLTRLRKMSLLEADRAMPPFDDTNHSCVTKATCLVVTDFKVIRNGISIAAVERFEATISKANVLIGPRGAGKSTLIRAIAGLEDPSSGSIFVDGTQKSWSTLRKTGSVSYLPQHPTLFDSSILKNLTFGSESLLPNDIICDEIVHSTGLFELLVELGSKQAQSPHSNRSGAQTESDLAISGLMYGVGRYGSNLSGGERQLVAICRCLLRRRPVVILDEPINHLDPALRSKVLSELMRPLPNRIVVFSTHNFAEVDLSTINACRVLPAS